MFIKLVRKIGNMYLWKLRLKIDIHVNAYHALATANGSRLRAVITFDLILSSSALVD